MTALLAAVQRAKIYVNGVLDVTGAEASTTLPNSSAALYVGLATAGSTSFTSGLIDDLRIYRTVGAAS